MATITFDQIHARVAEHQAAEAARNAPMAVARRAVFELSALLADMTDAERADVLALLAAELGATTGLIDFGTREETDALGAAWVGVRDTYDGHWDAAGPAFTDGWLAGRDWARQQRDGVLAESVGAQEPAR